MNKTPRQVIISLHEKGLKNTEISRRFFIAKSTILDTIKRYKELGNLSDRPRRGRKKIIKSPKLIKKVGEKMRRRTQEDQ